jgi:dolichyl-phosphate beta-glucosyltransferase
MRQMTESPEVFLSVIIPAFNEQERIADSLYLIKDYLSKQSYRSEIIVVDDGSSDLTMEIVKFIDIYGREIKEQDEGTILENIKNVGKGFSVARGMIKARGKLVLFSDADLSTPIEEIEKLLPHINEGYSIVIGSRGMTESIVEKKPFHREIISNTLNIIVKLLAVSGIQDTQCGFKLYTRDAAQRVALLQRIYGFAFDIEHLYIARKLHFKIKEVPVKWDHKDGSKVDLVKESIRMILDMIKIRYLHRNLRTKKL